MLSSFGKEDFQGFALISYVQSVFGFYFGTMYILVPPTFEQTLIKHTQGLFLCNI